MSVVMMYAFVCVENVLQFSESAISFVLQKIVALQFIFYLAPWKFAFLVHLVQMVDEVNYIRMFDYLLSTQHAFPYFSDLTFDLFYSHL